MKFLQLFPFYEAYLADYYQLNPMVARLPFDQQVSALVRDGFSGAHMIAPYMASEGYETIFIPVNVPHAQVQWANEHGLTSYDATSWIYVIVQAQIEFYKPDVLYISDPIRFDSRFTKLLDWRPKLIMAWRASVIPDSVDWSDFDIVLTNVDDCREKALRAGAKSVKFFLPGFPSEVLQSITEEDKQFDVVFSGQIVLPLHNERQKILSDVARAQLRMPDFSLAYFMSSPNPSNLPPEIQQFNRGPCYGLEMHRRLKQGKIILNPIGDPLGVSPDLVNVRYFEVTGTGSLMLTNFHKSLSSYFVPGVELETFCNSAELLEKVHYYLDHPDEREAIARRGQERCLREHSLSNRAAELHELIRRHLADKESSVHGEETAQSRFEQLMAKKENMLKSIRRQSAPESPLTGKANVRLQGEVDTSFLVEGYASAFHCDVRRFFSSTSVLQLYECLDTGYRFYYPFEIGGDSAFYEELARFPWYYMDWKWEHEIASQLIKPNVSVLEIGCGQGGFLTTLRNRLTCRCVGLEFNVAAASTARKQGLTVLSETVEEHAELHHGEYDVVCHFQVLEHVAHVRTFMDASLKLLKLGGTLILSVPNNDSFLFLNDPIQLLNRPPHHLGLWNLNALISLSRLFPLRLDGVKFEPLQPYHFEWAEGLAFKNLQQNASADLRSQIIANRTLVSETLSSVVRQLDGHTVIAHYTRM